MITDNPMTKYRILAEANSRHIRITHTLAKGDDETAAVLLLERMQNTLLDHQEGEPHNRDIQSACERVLQEHGPLIQQRMAQAAIDEIRALKHA
jgi:hypothetical protein